MPRLPPCQNPSFKCSATHLSARVRLPTPQPPLTPSQRNRGHVINMSSIAGHEAYVGGSGYCATKHAVDAMTKAARHDLNGTDIRVTSISPGVLLAGAGLWFPLLAPGAPCPEISHEQLDCRNGTPSGASPWGLLLSSLLHRELAVPCLPPFTADTLFHPHLAIIQHPLSATPPPCHPGAVRTEFSVVRTKGDLAAEAAVYAGIDPLRAADIADNVLYAATRPPHVQVADIVVLASYQSSARNLARVKLPAAQEA